MEMRTIYEITNSKGVIKRYLWFKQLKLDSISESKVPIYLACEYKSNRIVTLNDTGDIIHYDVSGDIDSYAIWGAFIFYFKEQIIENIGILEGKATKVAKSIMTKSSIINASSIYECKPNDNKIYPFGKCIVIFNKGHLKVYNLKGKVTLSIEVGKMFIEIKSLYKYGIMDEVVEISYTTIIDDGEEEQRILLNQKGDEVVLKVVSKLVPKKREWSLAFFLYM